MKNDKWSGSSSSSDLTEDPTDVSVRFSRGLEHLKNAEVDKAKQVFDDIISEDPEYAPAFFGLSCVHIRLNPLPTIPQTPPPGVMTTSRKLCNWVCRRIREMS